MCVLAKHHILRFGELKAVLGDVTDASLSLALTELQKEDIICRKQYEEIPPKVEYYLTDKGQSVIPILKLICQWSEEHYKMNEEEKREYNQCLNVFENSFNP